MNQRHSQNISHVIVDGRKCNFSQKWNNDKCQFECKKPIKYRACKEDYAWNPGTCASKCDKDCDIGKNLKDCECLKSLVDDLVAVCDGNEDTSKMAVINLSKKINYWLFCCCFIMNNVFKFYRY